MVIHSLSKNLRLEFLILSIFMNLRLEFLILSIFINPLFNLLSKPKRSLFEILIRVRYHLVTIVVGFPLF